MRLLFKNAHINQYRNLVKIFKCERVYNSQNGHRSRDFVSPTKTPTLSVATGIFRLWYRCVALSTITDNWNATCIHESAVYTKVSKDIAFGKHPVMRYLTYYGLLEFESWSAVVSRTSGGITI